MDPPHGKNVLHGWMAEDVSSVVYDEYRLDKRQQLLHKRTTVHAKTRLEYPFSVAVSDHYLGALPANFRTRSALESATAVLPERQGQLTSYTD
jgi:hypothetical protein